MRSFVLNSTLVAGLAAGLAACEDGSGSSSSNGFVGFGSSGTTFSAEMEPPPEAVTKGNFTVWTNPVSPAPRQDYSLLTAVILPANTKSYNATDLAGRLRGTDGYAIAFGGDTLFANFAFSPTHPRAVLSMQIPGAAEAGVQDTIVVGSRLLNEVETIVLTFSSGT